MTQITTPVPKSPFIDLKTGYVTREWYRFLTSLTQAVGGNTDVIIDIDISQGGADIAPDVGPIASLAQQADDFASQNAGQIEAIIAALAGLNPQIPGPVDLGTILAALTAQTPFAMPPIEIGSLLAAKNNVYRIVDAGNVTLVAGTATALTVQADGAREFCLTNRSVGGTPGILSVGTITAGVSFVINSTSATDTSVVSWVVLGPVRG